MERSTLDDIIERLRSTQSELEAELNRLMTEKRKKFQYTMQRGKVVFERSMQSWQSQQRTKAWQYLRDAPLMTILSAPLIYAMIIPLVILDASTIVFQQICFRLYGIPRVQRSDYLIIDRHHLAYLNFIEAANCVYCGYANGLIAFVREVASRLEQYWCPIKHARLMLDEHSRMQEFFDYGDADTYRQGLEDIRKDW